MSWVIFAGASVTALAVVALRWALSHPEPTNWDEANYLERVVLDRRRLLAGGVVGWVRSLVLEDRDRPPALRVAALPLVVSGRISAFASRSLAVVASVVTVGLTGLSVGVVGGASSGGFAAVLLATMPIFYAVNSRFYPDSLTCLALAGTLAAVGVHMSGGGHGAWIAAGLSVSLAVGMASKLSFLLAAAPIVGVAVMVTVLGGPSVGEPGPLLAGSAAAGVLLAPYLVANGRRQLTYATYAGSFSRHAVGGEGIERALRWLRRFTLEVSGPVPVAIVVGTAGWMVVDYLTGGLDFTDAGLTLAIGSGTAAVAVLATSFRAQNHNPRLMLPALPPLAVATATSVSQLAPPDLGPVAPVAGLGLLVQVLLSLRSGWRDPSYEAGNPAGRPGIWGNYLSVFTPTEQWDWTSLRRLAEARGLSLPSVAYLGCGEGLSPVQVRRVWLGVDPDARPRVTWLWRYEDGQPVMDELLTVAADHDLVFTVPGLMGAPDNGWPRDNAHNHAFASRLAEDDRFSFIGELNLGRFESMTAVVYEVRRH